MATTAEGGGGGGGAVERARAPHTHTHTGTHASACPMASNTDRVQIAPICIGCSPKRENRADGNWGSSFVWTRNGSMEQEDRKETAVLCAYGAATRNSGSSRRRVAPTFPFPDLSGRATAFARTPLSGRRLGGSAARPIKSDEDSITSISPRLACLMALVPYCIQANARQAARATRPTTKRAACWEARNHFPSPTRAFVCSLDAGNVLIMRLQLCTCKALADICWRQKEH